MKRLSAKSSQMGDASQSIWRVNWILRWLGTIGLGSIGAYAAIGLWEPGNPFLALGAVLVGGITVWLILWKPKAIIGAHELKIVNYFRTHLIPLEQISEPLFNAHEVCFELADGREILVSCIGWGLWMKDWFPSRQTRGEKFIGQVMSAKQACAK